jgi:hypothetical protein
MSIENRDQQSVHQMSSAAQTLEEFLLSTLEKHDGVCLDSEEERAALATILATALTSPEFPHQTTGSSASSPPAE